MANVSTKAQSPSLQATVFLGYFAGHRSKAHLARTCLPGMTYHRSTRCLGRMSCPPRCKLHMSNMSICIPVGTMTVMHAHTASPLDATQLIVDRDNDAIAQSQQQSTSHSEAEGDSLILSKTQSAVVSYHLCKRRWMYCRWRSCSSQRP
jgi:hypothetical protein